MGFFSMLLFNKLFFIHNECFIKYNKDSQEYKKCKELQEFNNILFQNFIEKNQFLLSQYIKLLEDSNNQKFLMQMYSIQKKIDDEINQYISQDEQIEFLKEFFKFEDMINDFEVNI
jgi:hypothetical protein